MTYMPTSYLGFYASLRSGNKSSQFVFVFVRWMLVKKTALQSNGEHFEHIIILGVTLLSVNYSIPYLIRYTDEFFQFYGSIIFYIFTIIYCIQLTPGNAYHH